MSNHADFDGLTWHDWTQVERHREKMSERIVQEGLNQVETDALTFCRAYTGRFQFILDLQTLLASGAKLSIGQLIGLVNCYRHVQQTKSRCRVCHKKLTTPVSLARGIGPICAK